jgi:drug/metabolite transporter (DMT)-like permease
MNELFYTIVFIGCVFISSCAQILLKKSANRNYRGLRVYLNVETLIGYAIFLGITLVTVFLYRRIELSTGTLLESSGYIFVSVLSLVFLKEKLSKNHIIGISFIIAGITIYALFGGLK